jgi:hypothetical protein
MVAMNSMPQQEVAKGRGQIELLRASPTTLSSEVVKKPSPENPSGASTLLMPQLLVSFCFILNRTGLDMVMLDD